MSEQNELEQLLADIRAAQVEADELLTKAHADALETIHQAHAQAEKLISKFFQEKRDGHRPLIDELQAKVAHIAALKGENEKVLQNIASKK